MLHLRLLVQEIVEAFVLLLVFTEIAPHVRHGFGDIDFRSFGLVFEYAFGALKNESANAFLQKRLCSFLGFVCQP